MHASKTDLRTRVVRTDLLDEETGAPRTEAGDHKELLHVLANLKPGELVSLETVWGDYEVEATERAYTVRELRGDGGVTNRGAVAYRQQVVAMIEYGLRLWLEWQRPSRGGSRMLWRVRLVALDQDQWPTVPELVGNMQQDKRTGHHYWQVEPATAARTPGEYCGDASGLNDAMGALMDALLAAVDRWLLAKCEAEDAAHAAQADAYWMACDMRAAMAETAAAPEE